MTANEKSIILNALNTSLASAKRQQNTNKNPLFKEVFEQNIAEINKVIIAVTDTKTQG